MFLFLASLSLVVFLCLEWRGGGLRPTADAPAHSSAQWKGEQVVEPVDPPWLLL